MNRRLCIAILACVPASAHADPQTTAPTRGEQIFALHVKSLFAEKCIACHGERPSELEGGLNMLSRDGLMRGGDAWGADVLKPGDGETSFLYIATTRTEEGFEMPPKEAEQLTPKQSRWIRDWINEGAPWPSDARIAEIQREFAAGEVVQTSGGLSDDWSHRRYEPEDLWAYRPLHQQEVPAGQHPIDWFVNRKLGEVGLAAAPHAEPREMARRLSFGLTGLPPSPDDAAQFAADFPVDSEAAVKALAQKLMSSEHYGEQFGRHWLDVTRYADSAGFANDYARPNAWRYRDYVIRSFNQDKSYTDFIREQIAGDEMEDAGVESVIATGFLRMGPWEQTAMSVFRVTRQQWLDDVTDSVGQVFLAHPLQCCKCHDHKFDPLPTRDYYSMMAVFSSTQFTERDAAFLPSENRQGFEKTHRWTQEKIKAYREQHEHLSKRVKQRRKQEKGDAKVGDNGLDPGDEASLARMKKNIARHTWELDRTKPIAFAVYTGGTIERKNVGNRIPLPENVWAKGELEQDTILRGGDAFRPGDSVEPAPLSAAQNLGEMDSVTFPKGKGKRRLALAKWIADPKNPLTARVMVNRVWSWHFGKGLAGNPNNFGATGAHPSHPQLLDYLASWFMQHNWSVKQLNELILTSETYRRSSRHSSPDELDRKDPTRQMYASFPVRRLVAEELRDAMLAVSGELNRQVGGIPARPEINPEVAIQPRQIMGGTASVYEPDPTPSMRNRRSIYAEKLRGLRDPFFETFNQPGADKSCEMRETSTIAPQALTLFNDEEVHDRALAFAARLLKQANSDEATIVRAFDMSISRPPSQQELTACLQRWRTAIREEEQKKYTPKRLPAEIERTVMAEKTGEPYQFREVLPAYQNYVPDLQPGQVGARTRGLAQVCLVLFNLNEFAYLD